MSVINDMLRDLNKRQAPEVYAGQANARQSLIQPRAKRLPYYLGGVLLLVALFLWAAWPWQSKQFVMAETQSEVLVHDSQSVRQDVKPQLIDQQSLAAKPVDVNNVDKPLVEPEAESRRVESAVVQMAVEAENVSAAPVSAMPVQEKTAAQKPAVELQIVESRVAELPTKKVVEPHEKVAEQVKPVAVEQAMPSASVLSAPINRMQVSLSPKALDEQMAQKAKVLLAGGTAAEAYRALLAFIAEHDEDNASRTVLANFLLQENRIAEAGDVLLNAAIDDYPELRQLKARWYAALGEHKFALHTLNAALPKIEVYPDYYVLLAAYYQRFSLFKEAIQTYNELLQFDDGIADWWAGLGISADRMSDARQAILAYQQALALPGLRPELENFVRPRLGQLLALRQHP